MPRKGDSRPCEKCGADSIYNEGISKAQKPYAGWFCSNKDQCGYADWADSSHLGGRGPAQRAPQSNEQLNRIEEKLDEVLRFVMPIKNSPAPTDPFEQS